MKTLSLLLSIAALAGVIGLPPVAGAAPAGAATTGTEATDPAASQAMGQATSQASSRATAPAAKCAGTQVVRADYLRRFGGSPVVGRIRVRKDSCSRYWAEVTMYQRMPPHAAATAYLTRYDADGKVTRWSCADGGATVVGSGQTTCRSPKIGSAGGADTFVASAQELHDGGGGYARVSWGQTVRTR